ncbi:lactate racemase domain-containing protein [Dysosmobacter sp.]|uniref:lactate racemase domain-containing protein n=1 Tax=Dysosmobacter sp. TaxID=2591382 RepID=UPI002A8FD520|nr:lactate racemase domain-containing protein [Dysosmobacter sp.]MDY3282781.1 lactate racemase domain-containing protein [Dysosmobacter sp.]
MNPAIEEILAPIELPEIVRVRQKFDHLELQNVREVLTRKLEDRQLDIRPGQRIAITCGSRGVDQYRTLVKTTVDFVKSRGAQPVLIPAMGSHGGATAEGQRAVLHHNGITEEAMGAPILSSMEVVQIGTTEKGLPVYIDKNAYECDGIILLNRVKCHTAFRGPIESGITKMTAIGLAKQKGAEMTHILGFENMGENILAVAKVTLSTLRIVCGIGTIEDAFGRLSEVHVLKQEEILTEEPKLLKRANELMPRYYVDGADVLVMMEMGKDVSGSGLDSNLIGRYNVPGMTGGPKFRALCVLDLTDASDHNPNGMGQADFASRRFYEKCDLELAYVNCLTSTAIGTAKMPMILDTDRQVLQAAAKFCGKPNRLDASIIIGVSTHEMGEIYMSKAALDSVPEKFRDKIEVVGDFFPIPFDEEGNLTLFGRPLSK